MLYTHMLVRSNVVRMIPPGWKFAARCWMPTGGHTCVSVPAAAAGMNLIASVQAKPVQKNSRRKEAYRMEMDSPLEYWISVDHSHSDYNSTISVRQRIFLRMRQCLPVQYAALIAVEAGVE